MATLALAAAGAAAGNALLPAGLSVLGTTLSGATIGAQIGALAGSYVDQALLGTSGRQRSFSGPRLKDLAVTSSTEGAPIPRIYGQVRLGGQIIWARDIQEVVVTTRAGGRSKGGAGSSRGAATVTQTEYRYYATFAVAIAEGEISGIGRVWADGQELDLTSVTWRLYRGTETQMPDTLIAAIEGAGRAPAFRGVAYVVFEQLALADFGNRIPQLSFEVSRVADDLDKLVRAVVMIPSSGEFVYATEAVTRDGAGGSRIADNVHTRQAATDWAAALDQLEAQLPMARAVSLAVAWFGDDLRAGQCTVSPRVDRAAKETRPLTWSVAGLDRTTARLVSHTADGRPAYGGTPSDQTVVAAIRDLKARGFTVTYNPFLLLDVPAGDARPDPESGTDGQPPYPWRGRIAPMRSADTTPAVAADIAAFVGTCRPEHFVVTGDTVVYGGPAEWSYRRAILHQAFLAKAAGGVDAFLLGSELRGLTTARDARRSYPFVAALVELAADVKAVLGPATKVTYAADWTEWFGHQPADGTGDVAFHLDPLWASPAVDAVAIDLYWPLADWRDGGDHADARAGARSIYDVEYLKGNIAAGEGFDWYYASAAERAAQVRRPITDGAGKPWVFRPKDIRSWWQNVHFDRPLGIESATPTAWVPQSKPVWLMEIGCPAVDKGANQPNVFVDPKSAESSLPHFSNGERDDLMQRRYLRALIEALTPGHAGARPDLNPVSSVYGGPMIPAERIHVYAWDARPFPAFPADGDTWGDAGNWRLGHWICGRLTRGSLAETAALLLADMGFDRQSTDDLVGIVPGYVVDRIMTAREALEPLQLAYFFDAVETGGRLRLAPRGTTVAAPVYTTGGLVERRPGERLCTLSRAQEADLPGAAKVTFLSAGQDYRQAVAEARRLAGVSGRIAEAQLPVVLDAEQAVRIAESWLFETWAGRETATFTLPPSALAIEPGDVVRLDAGAGTRLFRVVETGDHGARDIEARSFDPLVYSAAEGAPRDMRRPDPVTAGQPTVVLLDLPVLGSATGTAVHVAAAASPWPGALAIYRSPDTSGYSLAGRIPAPATMGRTLSALGRGPVSRRDRTATLTVALDSGTLESVTPIALFGGANTAAVDVGGGRWEVLQYERAELIASDTYRLSGLLRGQAGTEDLIADTLAAGARFVLLDAAVTRLDMTLADFAIPYRWRIGPADRDIGHPDYVERVEAFAGRQLKPLAPVHLAGRRSGGDVRLSWVRRTRSDGDPWEMAEVPLGEAEERYRIEILAGAAVVRTLTTTAPTATYTAADQVADFGTPPSTVTVRIAQMSAVAGAGIPATATL